MDWVADRLPGPGGAAGGCTHGHGADGAQRGAAALPALLAGLGLGALLGFYAARL